MDSSKWRGPEPTEAVLKLCYQGHLLLHFRRTEAVEVICRQPPIDTRQSCFGRDVKAIITPDVVPKFSTLSFSRPRSVYSLSLGSTLGNMGFWIHPCFPDSRLLTHCKGEFRHRHVHRLSMNAPLLPWLKASGGQFVAGAFCVCSARVRIPRVLCFILPCLEA